MLAEIPSWFVILMGIGTVFTGLICIVFLCKILSAVCSIEEKISGNNTSPVQSPVPTVTPSVQNNVNRQEIIAAIGTVIAEENGVDVNAIRIVSIKKI